MKKTVAGLLIAFIFVPSFAFAQVEPVQDQSVLISELHQQLIELLQAQVAVLIAQLKELKDGQDEIKTETKRIAEKVDKEDENTDQEEDTEESKIVENKFTIEGVLTRASSNTPEDEISASYGSYQIKVRIYAEGSDIYLPIDDIDYSIVGSSFSGQEDIKIICSKSGDYCLVPAGKYTDISIAGSLNPDTGGIYGLSLDKLTYSFGKSGDLHSERLRGDDYQTDSVSIAN